jgi:hypothetical protein
MNIAITTPRPESCFVPLASVDRSTFIGWRPEFQIGFNNLKGLGAMAAALSGHVLPDFACPRKAVGMAPDIDFRNELATQDAKRL